MAARKRFEIRSSRRNGWPTGRSVIGGRDFSATAARAASPVPMLRSPMTTGASVNRGGNLAAASR